MPTTRARHMITETDDVELALDEAALAWPELRGDRPALLRRLITTGASVAQADRAARLAERRAAIRDTSGAFADVWPADAVQRMRDEWPE